MLIPASGFSDGGSQQNLSMLRERDTHTQRERERERERMYIVRSISI